MEDGFLPDRSKYHREAKRDTHMGVLILAGIAMLIICTFWLPKAVRIAFDLGTPGTYVVGDVPTCDDYNNCRTYAGTFSSDDGKVVRTDVYVNDRLPEPLRQGDRIRAFDVGDNDEVYTNEGDNGYPAVMPVLLGLTGAYWVGMGARHFWRTRKRR